MSDERETVTIFRRYGGGGRALGMAAAVVALLAGSGLQGASAVQASTAGPAAQPGAQMAYDATSGQLVLFGGADHQKLGVTWVWNGSDWVKQNPATKPPALRGAAMAYDAATGDVVMFGGDNGHGVRGGHLAVERLGLVAGCLRDQPGRPAGPADDLRPGDR
ncbi:MAG TPA: hypothetical protein VHY58_05785 [Streptosporangiaceae bacterium]|nr:hypothetical protein [Streptosporangiaceae bacterium]